MLSNQDSSIPRPVLSYIFDENSRNFQTLLENRIMTVAIFPENNIM